MARHRERLFRPLQMDNAVIEFVPHQYLAGGSLAYFNARDWARYGFMYLKKGNYFGQQVVSESWVEYSCTLSPSSNGEYGAHWWKNNQGVDADICIGEGFRKQNVFVLPNRNVVIVRNAMPQLDDGPKWYPAAFFFSFCSPITRRVNN